MTPEQAVLIEAIFYISLIFSIPFIYKLVYAISLVFYREVFPIKEIIITVVRDGVEQDQIIKLDNSEHLIDALLHAKQRGLH